MVSPISHPTYPSLLSLFLSFSPAIIIFINCRSGAYIYTYSLPFLYNIICASDSSTWHCLRPPKPPLRPLLPRPVDPLRFSGPRFAPLYSGGADLLPFDAIIRRGRRCGSLPTGRSHTDRRRPEGGREEMRGENPSTFGVLNVERDYLLCTSCAFLKFGPPLHTRGRVYHSWRAASCRTVLRLKAEKLGSKSFYHEEALRSY